MLGMLCGLPKYSRPAPTAHTDTKMDEPLGWAHVDLEARFHHVRCGESNLGNFFADCLRIALQAGPSHGDGGRGARPVGCCGAGAS